MKWVENILSKIAKRFHKVGKYKTLFNRKGRVCGVYVYWLKNPDVRTANYIKANDAKVAFKNGEFI